MKGTEKQVKYAQDIIAKTIARIDEIIEKGKIVIERNESVGYVDTWNRKRLAVWEECHEYMATLESEVETAAEVIEMEKEYGWFNYLNMSDAFLAVNGSQIG